MRPSTTLRHFSRSPKTKKQSRLRQNRGLFCFAQKQKKGGEAMGRKRKVQTPDELWKLWENFKNKCDSETSVTHSFSAKKKSSSVSWLLSPSAVMSLNRGNLSLLPPSPFLFTMNNGDGCHDLSFCFFFLIFSFKLTLSLSSFTYSYTY